MTPGTIAVCVKWVDQRVDADAVLASAPPDERFGGVSAADQAALEWALRQRDSSGPGGSPSSVVAVTVGPASADSVLRDALAAGADRAVRVDWPFGMPSSAVATALSRVVAEATTIWCGDYSFDRGTGSVPAFLADALGIAQALGIVALDLPTAGEGPGRGAAPAVIVALRRLDGGRRERLAIDGRAVISVEGSTALLRRAPLRGLLGKPTIEVVSIPPPFMTAHSPEARPYRPRPRTFAPPAGTTALERIKVLTSAAAQATHGETVTLDPPAAAERILAALAEWGYLPDPPQPA